MTKDTAPNPGFDECECHLTGGYGNGAELNRRAHDLLFEIQGERPLMAIAQFLQEWTQGQAEDASFDDLATVMAQHRWNDPVGAQLFGEVVGRLLARDHTYQWLEEIALGRREPVFSEGRPVAIGGADLLGQLRSAMERSGPPT